MKLVTYDLNRPGQQYATLYEGIKSLGTHWHCLDSTWLLKTSYSTEQVRDHLKKFIDTNDKLLVVDFDGWAATGFPLEGYSWMKN